MTHSNEVKYEGTYEAKPFKYVSLFSGIGGFEQALNAMGGECVLASEIDKFANQAYEALYGHATAGDITAIDTKDVPDHDLLVGGFPCQAFSVAGKRLGFEDTRGTLFFEVARIAREKQPKAILLENVKGLVGHDKGRTLDVIVQTLNDIGYTVDFEVLNSKYFGVPQNRERIFIIAVRDDLITTEPWIIEGNTIVPKGKRRISAYESVKTFNFDWPAQDEVTTRLRDVLEAHVDEKYYLSDDKTAKLVAQLEANPSEDDIPLENMGRLAGLRNRTDRVFAYQGDKKRSTAQENIYLRDEAIADSVTVGHMPKYINAEPQMLGHVDIAEEQEWWGEYESEQDEWKQEQELRQGLPIREATKKGYALAGEGDAGNFQFPDSKTRRGRVGKGIANTLEASSINQGVVERAEPNMLGHIDIKGHDAIKRVYDPEYIGPTLTTMGVGHREPKIAVVGNLKPEGCTRHGQRDNVWGEWGIAGTLNASDYKQPRPIAEEVRPVLTPDRAEKRQNGRRFKEDGEEAFTLTAQDKHGVAIGVKPRYRIRKLTPLECFRLQGFPDEAHQTLVGAGISDSQRYKQAGNAVTVNVIRALSERLLPLITSPSGKS